jgi:hypothetical protein
MRPAKYRHVTVELPAPVLAYVKNVADNAPGKADLSTVISTVLIDWMLKRGPERK